MSKLKLCPFKDSVSKNGAAKIWNRRRLANTEFSISELNYLYSLVLSNQETGEYWGRKDQFIKRQERVIDKLITAKFFFSKG